MATCIICNKRIGNREPRSYVTARNRPELKDRKYYACGNCQEAFDRWIDSRATVDDGMILLTTDSPILLALQRINWNHGRGTVVGYNLRTGIVERSIQYGQSAATAQIETRRFRFDGKTVFFLGHQQRIS
jgi:hypothetical protein